MYWNDRQKQLYAQLEKDEKKLNDRLISYYKTEYSKLDKEIAAFYQKYGVNNIIEYRTVMQALSDEDRVLLIEQMDEFAKQYPQYAHLMPVRKNIYKLNRLEGLQQSVVMHQLKIGAVNDMVITEYLNKQALRGVTAAAKAMGFGTEFYFESADIIKNIIGVQWCNGENYSERIWENTNKLAYYLTTDISQGFARGENYQSLTKQLRERFLNVNAKDAYRLVYTEGTYVMAESSIQPFVQDFERYKISTAADGKVCPLCADISHKVFYIKDRAAGVNFPPFHPWCRCTFEIVVDDWDAWLDGYAQRHNTDKQQTEKVLKRFKDYGIINKRGEGILDITIDEFTPCLEDAQTGKILETSYSLVSKSELRQLKNWKFDWLADDLKNADIYKLQIKGDSKIQGLVALTKFERDKAIYVNIAESAPHNLGKNKQYKGVGGHLFAIAAQISKNLGYGGFVFMDAKNVELVKHYRETLGAQFLGIPHQYRMFIDEAAAEKLLKIYTLNREVL